RHEGARGTRPRRASRRRRPDQGLRGQARRGSRPLRARVPVRAGGPGARHSLACPRADRRPERAGEVLGQLAVPSYAGGGFVMGGFHEGNDGTAIYNAGFRPFTSPVPFLLLRQAVVGDWKFFLENDEWLDLWARRHGEAGARALAVELRAMPWRARHRSA